MTPLSAELDALSRRGPRLPLLAGLLASVALHALLGAWLFTLQRTAPDFETRLQVVRDDSPPMRLVPAWTVLPSAGAAAADASRPKRSTDSSEPPAPSPERPAMAIKATTAEEEEVHLGRDGGLPAKTAAWIAHDADDELHAPKGRTLQPALQKEATPLAGAPMVFDATDPGAPGRPGKAGTAGQEPAQTTPRLATAARAVPSADALPLKNSQASGAPTGPATAAIAGKQTGEAEIKPREAELALAPEPKALEPSGDAPPTPVLQPSPPQPRPLASAPPAEASPPPPTKESLAASAGQKADPAIAAPMPPPVQSDTDGAALALATAVVRADVQPRLSDEPASPGDAARPPTPTDSPPSPPADAAPPIVVARLPIALPPPVAAASRVEATPAAAAPHPATPPPRGASDRTPSESAAPPAGPSEANHAGQGGGGGQRARPTGAPRSDRESPPSSLTGGTQTVKPGRVLVGEGIEVKTVTPRLSAVAVASTLPKNPTVRLTFDREGNVNKAEVLKSTGSANWDAPILASLYRWRAGGKKLAELKGPLVLQITLILSE